MTKDETLKMALDFLMTRRMGAEAVIEALNEALAQPPLPVQPERQPLTDEQIKVIHFDLCNTVGSDYKTVARAIEAAHNIGAKQ